MDPGSHEITSGTTCHSLAHSESATSPIFDYCKEGTWVIAADASFFLGFCTLDGLWSGLYLAHHTLLSRNTNVWMMCPRTILFSRLRICSSNCHFPNSKTNKFVIDRASLCEAVASQSGILSFLYHFACQLRQREEAVQSTQITRS